MRGIDQGKEFCVPSGILSFTFSQMVASATLNLAKLEVGFGDGVGAGFWRDSAVLSLPVVAFVEAVFKAGNAVFEF